MPAVTEDADVTLDAKGLNCPLPVLRARKAMRGVPPGGLLRVLATDPAAVADFRAYCDQTGHGFVASAECAPGVLEITLRRKAKPGPAQGQGQAIPPA